MDRRRGMGLHPQPRRPDEPAARSRLSQHRLCAVHARDRARRGHPCGPLVVGTSRAQGMRTAPAAARHRRTRRARWGSFMNGTRLLEPALRDADAGAIPADVHHLGWLESEAIHILREVAGQCHNPALLFSGGKDSLVLLRLPEKAFRPGAFPFPLLHIDTGHNFPEGLAFRDRRAAEPGQRMLLPSPADSLAVPSIYLAHSRPVVRRGSALVPVTALTPPRNGDIVEHVSVRFRTVGDITCTAPVASLAKSIEAIIAETAATTITERGATRLDDQTSDASMELRKKEGYF